MENDRLIRNYAVYLAATSNKSLSERMDNGEIIEGMLHVNFGLHELTFTFGERIAFQYNHYMMNSEKVFEFSDGTSFYSFTIEKPETIKVRAKVKAVK